MLEASPRTPESGVLEGTRQSAETLLRNEVGRQRMFFELRKAGLANPSLAEDCSSLRDHMLNYASSERMGLDVSMLKDEIVKAYEKIVGAAAVATGETAVPEKPQEQTPEHVVESVTPVPRATPQRRRDGPFLKLVVDNTKPAEESVAGTSPVAEEVVAQVAAEEVKEEAPVVETLIPEVREVKETAERPVSVRLPETAEVQPEIEKIKAEVEEIHRHMTGMCGNALSMTTCGDYVRKRVDILRITSGSKLTPLQIQECEQKVSDLRDEAAKTRAQLGIPESTPESVVKVAVETVEPSKAPRTEVVQEVVPAQPAPVTTPEDHKLALIQMMKSKEVTQEVKERFKKWTEGGSSFFGMVRNTEVLARTDLDTIIEEHVTMDRIMQTDLLPHVQERVADNAVQNLKACVDLFITETGVEPSDTEELEYYVRRALATHKLAQSAPLKEAA